MKYIYFSPKSTTKQVAKGIAAAWKGAEEWDLMAKPMDEAVTVGAEEPVLVALPVYAGRIPPLCIERLRGLKGSGGPAVAVVVYGNRAYDDALLELADLLTEQGFAVVAAGAFIGRHSIYTNVAKGRPDEADRALMAEFGERCRAAADCVDPAGAQTVKVPGDPAYRETPARVVPLKPIGNRNCVKCRACVRRCPKGAIPEDEPTQTDREKCISCGLCIYICPMEARGYFYEEFAAGAAAFEEKNGAYRTPEWFF